MCLGGLSELQGIQAHFQRRVNIWPNSTRARSRHIGGQLPAGQTCNPSRHLRSDSCRNYGSLSTHTVRYPTSECAISPFCRNGDSLRNRGSESARHHVCVKTSTLIEIAKQSIRRLHILQTRWRGRYSFDKHYSHLRVTWYFYRVIIFVDFLIARFCSTSQDFAQSTRFGGIPGRRQLGQHGRVRRSTLEALVRNEKRCSSVDQGVHG